MKRCRSPECSPRHCFKLTTYVYLSICLLLNTNTLPAGQAMIDRPCLQHSSLIKKNIYIYISLKVQTLSHNWKVHEKVKGNMIKNILPHEKCMPNVKVSRLKQCLFSQTEEELVERTDGFNSFLMSNSYLCYWNIWSLSAADFPRMDWSVTQPCQVMDFVLFLFRVTLEEMEWKDWHLQLTSILLPCHAIYYALSE